jgi:hypothetical protein
MKSQTPKKKETNHPLILTKYLVALDMFNISAGDGDTLSKLQASVAAGRRCLFSFLT